MTRANRARHFRNAMAFKSKTRNRIAIGILFFSLLAIVVTGFGTGGFGGLSSLTKSSGDGSDTLATVDGKPVTATEVQDLVNRAFARARQQQPTIDMATFLAGGTYDQILAQMITADAVQHFAETQGIAISPTMIDREIVNIPAFRNFSGQFDQATYEQQLHALNLTDARLRQDIAQSLSQRQLLGPVALGGRVPDGVAREYANLLLERRAGTLTAVPSQLFESGINPTDAEVAAFYRTNRALFTIPERRAIKFALVGIEQVADTPPATEAEIEQVYRNSPRSFAARESRNLQSIVLPTEQAAQAFAQRVRAGTSFVQAASEAGFQAADVTFNAQSRDQFAGITNAQVANVAFGAAQGAVVGPIRSELGFHVVRIDHIASTPARPLEQVRAQIVAYVNQKKRENALGALVSQLQDQLSAGASFDEVARAHHLTVVTTPPVTANGEAVGATPPWTAPPELAPLLHAAFEIDPEDPTASVEHVVPNQRFALLGLDHVVAAAPPPLAQIAPQVRAALVRQRARQQARALADRIAQRINSGTPAAQALAEAQPRLPAGHHVEMQRLDISHQGQQVPPALIALFSIPQGHARVMPGENNAGWVIVVHESRTPGDASSNAALIQTARTEFSGSVNEELAQQFARAIEARSEIVRNEDAIRRARQTLMGAATPVTD
jgi:peptidyl-prolyl cis-trans isomerase D